MLNLQIEQFKKNIYNVLNNSNLLIGTAYYVMKDVLYDLEKNYIQSLRSEQQYKYDKNFNETQEIEVDVNTDVAEKLNSCIQIKEE